MNPDHPLAFLDFAEAYEREPEKAVQALSALLLDERACNARIEFLLALQRRANADRPGRFPCWADEHSDDAIGLIREMGIARALQQRRLDVLRLDALTRHPDTLRRLHRAVADNPSPSNPVPQTTTPTGRGLRMMRVFYSPQYVGSGYSFDTTRKARWVADSLAKSPIPNIELVEPTPLTREMVTAVHDPDYVRAIETGKPRSLAESQGFEWDAGLWPMVLASNGGAVAAALAAFEHGIAGSLSSGLHHARYGCGAGFCTFNGLVLAANAVLAAGAESVLILDLDAHCGGGTASLIATDPRVRQVDVSVSSYDAYSESERARLAVVRSGAEYLGVVRHMLDVADRLGPFRLCLYNAGMDPSEDCSTGGCAGITRAVLAERERLVFEWCAARKLPVAFVLAGGYIGSRLDENGLVALHRLTLSAASSVGGTSASRRT
jgi:acetoin utilization deacetylase AcuC-like enzyme